MKTSFMPLVFLCCVGYIQSKPSSQPCPSGQFALKNQCVLCHPTCSECAGHELFECTSCGVDEEGLERFLHQGHCRPHCPRGTYPERARYSCLPCMANCELCVDAHVCAKCRDGYRLFGGICQVALCRVGQVEDPETGECVDCEPGCKSCTPDDPELCNSCTEGYFLYRYQCRRHCPQRTFEDQDRGLCQGCPSQCADCRSSTLCLACQPGHFLHGFDCVKECPEGTFGDGSGWRCQSCHTSCQTCHGPHMRDCDLCPSGTLPVYGQCPVPCQQGQYFDGIDSECHYCDVSCKTCFGPKALDCSSCFTGYILDQEGACVEHCVPGSFANVMSQLCEECSPNCETCEGASDKCVSCKSGPFKLLLHQGRCWSNCPDGFFETAEGMCEACEAPCVTCDVSGSQCLSCGEGNFLEGGQCRVNCSLDRSYAAADGMCRRCAPHCDACIDDKTCSKCSFLYLLLNGVCQASCPEGYFEDLDEGHCVRCHPSCATCSGPLADDCETCSTPTPKLYEGTCSEECPDSTYFETSTRECQECHQTCARCTGPEPNLCTQCGKGLALDPNTLMCGVTGDSGCPPRTFLHANRFTCQACQRQCQSCEGPGPADCLTCALPRYLHKGLCVSECPAGSYAASEEADGMDLGFCSTCDHVCATCSGASPKDCTSCSRGYLRLLHLCVSHCPTGFYADGDRCEKCHRSCDQCSGPGPESCQACPAPLLELHGTRLCVEHCPQRFYQTGQRCTQCHTSCQSCTDSNPQSCVTCDWGSILQKGVCYPRCEESRYLSLSEVCELCDGSCRHCSAAGPQSCLTCHAGFALHAMEGRCVRCCPQDLVRQHAAREEEEEQREGEQEHETCCVCDPGTALCVETPTVDQRDQSVALGPESSLSHRTAATLPTVLCLALLVALGVFGLVQARARKRLCWGRSYERLSGTAGYRQDLWNMPHGVPEPEDSADEVDVVYTSRDGSVYRRYSFIHESDAVEGEEEVEEEGDKSTQLNKA
ncbi:proprotein convertase subtilisin/kexin type 5 isoform X1 [Alosa alosa]|uniref:proprotein convertase subtilisin/kexin type 5 isoform X1 n=1 Tax=Alosa alosa TaxID=278164 RepID=UPI0020153717|nr:proprotein convertase subtilisin/kexin type 5 isoform X1 [Alosa alosa]